jgi:hypothetical protein
MHDLDAVIVAVDYCTTFVDEFHLQFRDPKSPPAISLAGDVLIRPNQVPAELSQGVAGGVRPRELQPTRPRMPGKRAGRQGTAIRKNP